MLAVLAVTLMSWSMTASSCHRVVGNGPQTG
jgi:hypothetical protein